MITSTKMVSSVLPPEIRTLLERGEMQICLNWYQALERKLGVSNFDAWKKRERDEGVGGLPSLFLKLLADDSVIRIKDITGLLIRIRQQTYSFSTFFAEVTCLENAIVRYIRAQNEIDKTAILDTVSLIHARASELIDIIIREIVDIYEYVIENGQKGFCQMDIEGRISNHNKQMVELLGEVDIKGKKLEAFFENDDEKVFIRQAVQAGSSARPSMRKLYLTAKETKDPIPVGVELAPILIDGKSCAVYACFTNITQPEQQMLRVFDRSPLGILKASISGTITYANDELLNIFGVEKWKGKTIREILGDGQPWAEVEKALERRKQGLSDEYRLEITRGGSKKIPIMVSAAPETDLSGKPTGTLAIIRSLEREETITAIHQHIEKERDWKILLDNVANEIKRVVSYDLCIFTRYSDDGKHSRELTHQPQRGQLIWSRRWWEISDPVRNFLNQKQPMFNKLNDFLASEVWSDLRNDPEFQKILKTGAKAFFFLPVLKGGKVTASVTLFSNSEDAYNSKDQKALLALPLDSALLMALYYQDRLEIDFRLGLQSELLTVSQDVKLLAEVLVRRIGEHYDWDNVSLFRVDEDTQMVILEKEYAKPNTPILGPDFCQPWADGLLGWVIDTGEPQCLSDVNAVYSEGPFIKALESTKSAFCLPITISGHVRWLLNIEGSTQNAFSEENKTALAEIVRDLVGQMKRMRTQQIMSELLNNASDGILTTDGKGNVAKANPAWARLLGYSKDDLKGRDVTVFFTDPKEGKDLLEAGRVPNRKVWLRRADGESLEVLLSVSQLSKELAGKVLIAKDLALAKRKEELDYLERMYYEIATQTKTPLSLAFTWLHRLKEAPGAGTDVDTIIKILEQLRRVDLTFDRLSFYSRKDIDLPAKHYLLGMDEVITKVLEDLPQFDREQIVREEAEHLPMIRGNLYQLVFCFQSILSFLLRFSPNEKRIQWRLWLEKGKVVSEISGYFPFLTEEKPGDLERVYQVSKTLTEIATGNVFVKRLIKDHGGHLSEPSTEGDIRRVRVELPVAEEL